MYRTAGCSSPEQYGRAKTDLFTLQATQLKGLVGVAPNAVIMFCSELFPGSTSDKEIVKASEILSKLSPGDILLADKAFNMHDILPQGVSSNVPPVLTHSRFTPQQCEVTTRIAQTGIHVERAITRMKGCTMLISAPYRKLSSKIFKLCASPVNLQSPLIKEIYFYLA